MKFGFDWPAAHPRMTLLIAAVLVIVSLLLVFRLDAEASLDAMLDPTDPATGAMTRVLSGFPAAQELLVMCSAPDGREVDRAALLAFAERFQTALASSDLVRAVRYRPSSEARQFVEKVIAPAGLLYLTDEQLAEARRRLEPEAMIEQFRRNEAMLSAPGPAAGGLAKAILQDPLRLHELLQARLRQLTPPDIGSTDGFFSPSGRDLLIRIEGNRPMSEFDFAERLTALAHGQADLANTDGLDLRIGGGYAISAHNAAVIRGESISNSVGSVFTLGLAFLVLFRRPAWTFAVAFTPIAVGILCGFGVYALFSDTITPLAAVIGGALGGIGIDYSTHMLAHHRREDRPGLLVRRMAWPLLAACATSVIGFAVIGISPVRLLRDFAIVGSLSLIGAFIAALTVLPALLALRPAAADPRVRVMRAPWRYPGRVLAIALLLLLPAAILATGVDLGRQDQDVHNLHPQPNPPLDATEEISRRMGMAGGSFMIWVSGSSDEEVMQRAAEVQQKLASSDAHWAGVRSVFGPASLLPAPSMAAVRRADFTDEQIAAATASLDRAIESSGFAPTAYDPYRSFLPKLLRPERVPGIAALRAYPELASAVLPRDAGRHEAIVHLFLERPPTTRDEVERTVSQLRWLLDGVPGATLTGMSVISQQTLAAVQRDLPRVAILAAGCVALYLILHYRSPRLGLMAMLPTFVSLTLLLATMRLTGISLNVVNMVMLPLLLGINIDFGIFAVDTLRKPEEHTLADQFTSSLQAMTTCAVTAIVGFGSLAFASVPAVRSLGILVMVGVAGCTLGAATVLWPIVLMMAKKRGLQ